MHVHGAWCHPSADGCPSEIPAPDFAPEQVATLARFDAAETPVEVRAVQRFAVRVAVDELRAAADELRQCGVGPEVFVVDDRADTLEATS